MVPLLVSWSPPILEEAPKFPAIFPSFFRRRFYVWFFWLLSHVQSGHLLEGSTLILRFLLSFDVSNVFGGGSKVVGKFSRHSCVSWIKYHTTYSGVSALVAGTWYPWGSPLCSRLRVFDLPTARLAELLTGYWSQVLPDSQGFPKFSDGMLHNCEQRPGKFSSCLLLFSSRDEEDFVRLLPFSPTGYFLRSRLSSFSARRKGKIVVIEYFFRLSLGLVITDWPCHIVNLQSAVRV